MDKLFQPITDLVGAFYGLVKDAAAKVWDLVKPIFLIGIVFDLVTGQLGWISQILEYYRVVLDYTSGASWFVLALIALFVLHFTRKS